MELFKRIRARREELNMSQEELAKLVGYKSRSSINKIEIGQNDISQSKIKAFADALQTTPAFLMGWIENHNGVNLTQEVATTERKIKNFLPSLMPKDEWEIARDLEAMLNSFDNESDMGVYNDQEYEEDRELLKTSLLMSMRIAKQIAKKKFTHPKYRER